MCSVRCGGKSTLERVNLAIEFASRSVGQCACDSKNIRDIVRLLKQAVRAFTQRTRDSIERTFGQRSIPDRGNSPQEEEYWVAPGKTKSRRPRVSRDKNVINDGRFAGGDITNYDRGAVFFDWIRAAGRIFATQTANSGEREYKRNNGAFPRGCKSAGIYRAAAQRHDKWAAVRPGELFDERLERPLLLLLNPR